MSTISTDARGSGVTVSSIPLSANYTSDWIDLPHKSVVYVQFVWTGVDAFNGTAVLESSNNASDADELNGSGACIEIEAGSQGWELTAFAARYLRLVWTANNVSTGTATMYVFTKRDL